MRPATRTRRPRARASGGSRSVDDHADAAASLAAAGSQRCPAWTRGPSTLADRRWMRRERRGRAGRAPRAQRRSDRGAGGASAEQLASDRQIRPGCLDSPPCRTLRRQAGLVLGVANKRSIAWAIAQRLADEGAQLAFTFQGERIEKSVRDLAATVSTPARRPSATCAPTPTSSGSSPRSAEAFDGGLDVLVHSVAFAAAEDLEGRFTDTPRDRFWLALDVSAYSLVACARAAEPLMQARGGGSIVTMTYLGGERAVPHYNVMGVAKATLDASVRYLAWDLGQKRDPRERRLGRPGAHARGPLDRRLPDDGGDRRGARAAAPPHRRGRRGRRRPRTCSRTTRAT